MLKPKKYFGQHFLKDDKISQQIAETLRRNDYKFILEIGPGMGILTKYLKEKHHKELFVIEIDKESVLYLKKNFPKLNNNIIEGDFLQLNYKQLFNNQEFAVIGNFPYNISTQIVFKVLENKELIPEFAGMFQKEVSERIASKHGNKKYGILSVLTQVYYNVEYLFDVDENVFFPPPRVKSGVIRLSRKETLPGIDYDFFKKFVKIAFNQRRKTLRNSLKSYNLSENLKQDSIFAKRPEQLSPSEFLEISKMIRYD